MAVQLWSSSLQNSSIGTGNACNMYNTVKVWAYHICWILGEATSQLFVSCRLESWLLSGKLAVGCAIIRVLQRENNADSGFFPPILIWNEFCSRTMKTLACRMTIVNIELRSLQDSNCKIFDPKHLQNAIVLFLALKDDGRQQSNGSLYGRGVLISWPNIDSKRFAALVF